MVLSKHLKDLPRCYEMRIIVAFAIKSNHGEKFQNEKFDKFLWKYGFCFIDWIYATSHIFYIIVTISDINSIIDICINIHTFILVFLYIPLHSGFNINIFI